MNLPLSRNTKWCEQTEGFDLSYLLGCKTMQGAPYTTIPERSTSDLPFSELPFFSFILFDSMVTEQMGEETQK